MTEATPTEAQETEALGHYITAELCGKPLQAIPSGAWRQSSMRKLRIGDLDGFLEDVLSPESFDLYLDMDPTNDEVNDWVNEAVDGSGESLGKSSGPTRSSRRTRKR